MKKPILAGIAVIAFAAASVAQNTSTLNQVGTNQTGIIMQVGIGHQATVTQTQGTAVNQGSLGFISQGSTNNTGAAYNIGFVNQNNGSKSNRAGIDQNVKPASGNGNNVATINQNGNGSYISGGTGAQILPTTGILTGTTPMAARMVGGNWAGITQEGNGTNTVGTVNQNAGGVGGSSANFANVYQNGTGSGLKTAIVDQSNNSVNNNATLYQGNPAGGLSNTVSGAYGSIEQTLFSQNNTAEMYQTKGVQTAYIRQNGFSSDNYAKTDQSSVDNGNIATINQNVFSDHNSAIIRQTAGAGRTATIDQSGLSSYNIGEINQAGTTPGATASNAQITQTLADHSKAYINQDTRVGASAIIYQHNTSGSYAKITQNTTHYDYGNTNVAEIEQTGSQSGIGNTATINQDYSANTAKLKQDGHNNLATINQVMGDLNVVKGLSGPVALQQGDNNTLTVTQASIDHLGLPFGPYTTNTASVAQIGNNNTGNIVQTVN